MDTHATFPGGSEGTGLEGLRSYLRQYRQEEFLDNLCRKMLAYALGRTLLLSDDITIDSMRANLAANDYRMSSLFETIVTSPQFLSRRIETEAFFLSPLRVLPRMGRAAGGEVAPKTSRGGNQTNGGGHATGF